MQHKNRHQQTRFVNYRKRIEMDGHVCVCYSGWCMLA
jgi:hypothetical protein